MFRGRVSFRVRVGVRVKVRVKVRVRARFCVGVRVITMGFFVYENKILICINEVIKVIVEKIGII